jgi:tight adherence protein C
MLLLFTIATFVVTTGAVISGYFFLTADSPVEQRLRTVIPESAAARAAAPKPRRSGLGPLGRMLSAIGSLTARNNDKSITKLLTTAGFRGPNALFLFVGARTIISVTPALAYLVPRISRGEPMGRTLYMSLLIWGIGHLLCMQWLRRRSRRRILSVQSALPDSLDLMVVCLEAGLGLSATIARVGEERSAMNDPLGEEFSQVSRELRDGRSREDALRALGDRNGVEDLSALVGLIVQADRLGASMAKTLRAHADVLRTKRRQRAEEAARKLPIKILFPLALFILPALFVVAIGPSVLRIGDLMAIVGSRRANR